MSWNLEINKPNGKSSQNFYCEKPWEAKHIAGKQHKKQHEFAATPGISCITDSPSGNGVFTISGRPAAVDKVKVAMGEWLKECQNMHYSKF